MNRYIRYYSEDEDDKNNNGIPDWLDPKITTVLENFRDSDFGNEEARKNFCDMILTLFNSKDKRSRKAFKAIGDLFTSIGDELINYGQETEE